MNGPINGAHAPASTTNSTLSTTIKSEVKFSPETNSVSMRDVRLVASFVVSLVLSSNDPFKDPGTLETKVH